MSMMWLQILMWRWSPGPSVGMGAWRAFWTSLFYCAREELGPKKAHAKRVTTAGLAEKVSDLAAQMAILMKQQPGQFPKTLAFPTDLQVLLEGQKVSLLFASFDASSGRAGLCLCIHGMLTAGVVRFPAP